MRPVLAIALLLALVAGVTGADAKRQIKPKAGGYIGKVTKGNGTGAVRLIVATFNFRDGRGDQKGPQLFKWTGTLRCDDGSSSTVSPTVFAPLKGAKFSGKSKSGAQTVTLKGRFTRNTRLKGTVRVKSSSPACDTGPVKFKAHLRR